MEIAQESDTENSPSSKGLFYANLRRDPLVIWALILGGLLGWGQGSEMSESEPLFGDLPGAALIELTLMVVFGVVFFVFIPAAIRRRLRRNVTLIGNELGPATASSKLLGLALAIGLVAFVGGEIFRSSSGSAAEQTASIGQPTEDSAPFSDMRCEQIGADEKCVGVEVFSRSLIRMSVDWNYGQVKTIGLSNFSSLRWIGEIDCESRTSRLVSLTAYDRYDRMVLLPEYAMTPMRQGIRREDLGVMVREMC
jgi:hypothetical protein